MNNLFFILKSYIIKVLLPIHVLTQWIGFNIIYAICDILLILNTVI